LICELIELSERLNGVEDEGLADDVPVRERKRKVEEGKEKWREWQEGGCGDESKTSSP